MIQLDESTWVKHSFICKIVNTPNTVYVYTGELEDANIYFSKKFETSLEAKQFARNLVEQINALIK